MQHLISLQLFMIVVAIKGSNSESIFSFQRIDVLRYQLGCTFVGTMVTNNSKL